MQLLLCIHDAGVDTLPRGDDDVRDVHGGDGVHDAGGDDVRDDGASGDPCGVSRGVLSS